MNRQRRFGVWRGWVLAGVAVFGVGGLAPGPTSAAPGFGTRSESDREKQRAERERQAQERRQQQETREAPARAERERQAQERQRAAEQRLAQDRQRAAEQRQTQDRQRAAEQARQLRERETRARAERERLGREAAERQQAAREAAEGAARQALPRRGFGVREPATRAVPDPLPHGEAPRESPAASPVPSTGKARPAGSPEGGARREPGWGLRDPNLLRQGGSLDRYFGPRGSDVGYRVPQPTERVGDRVDRSPRPTDRGDRGERAYREERHPDRNPRRHHPRRPPPCLYDVIYVPYPVTVIRERVRTEVVTLPSRTEVVVVPERPPGAGAPPLSPSERLARAVSLEEVLANIERAWLRQEVDLLLRHVHQERPFEIYRDGEFATSLDWQAFRERTREAMERYETLSMRFEAPRILSESEAVAAAEHRYRLESQFQRTRVVFAFAREEGAWWIVGMDYTSPEVEREGEMGRPLPGEQERREPRRGE